MTTTITKPRWVECADKAYEILDKAENKETFVREADAWMRLAYLYAARDEK